VSDLSLHDMATKLLSVAQRAEAAERDNQQKAREIENLKKELEQLRQSHGELNAVKKELVHHEKRLGIKPPENQPPYLRLNHVIAGHLQRKKRHVEELRQDIIKALKEAGGAVGGPAESLANRVADLLTPKVPF
jgi:cell division septum initiation protein DivIVA